MNILMCIKMWRVENLGSYKILSFIEEVRKPTTLLDIFFKMLELSNGLQQPEEHVVKKNGWITFKSSIMNQIFVFSQSFYVE